MGLLGLPPHDLRNKLTEIELAYQEAVAAAWAAHPEVAAAQQRFDEAAAAVAVLEERARADRARNRTARLDPDAVAELKQARAARHAGRQEVAGLKERYYTSIEPVIVAADQVRVAAIKASYAEAVDGGLYWATVNDVTAYHQARVARVTAKRQAGTAAQVRFSRWRGEATIAVQLQRRQGDPPRRPALLADTGGGDKWR